MTNSAEFRPPGPMAIGEFLDWAQSQLKTLGYEYRYVTGSGLAFSESDLIRETAWVILCTGFRESVVRSKFPRLSICFLDWVSCTEITEMEDICIATALDVFNSQAKLRAIGSAARTISSEGFATISERIKADPIGTLRSFDYIGETTSYHLAKNLGMDVSKPDRHLLRLAASHGYSDVHEFCETISQRSGLRVAIVDTILWKVCELGLTEHVSLTDIKAPDNTEPPLLAAKESGGFAAV